MDYFPLISSTDDDLEDIETAKVGETFVTTNRKASWRRCFITVALTAQIILDILVFVTIFYVYSHKGPRNAIFPQALYCMSTFYGSVFYSLPFLVSPFSASTGCSRISSVQMDQWIRV